MVGHILEHKHHLVGGQASPIKDFITLEELSPKPHILEGILDSQTKLLHSKEIRQFKIKWMNKPIGCHLGMRQYS